MWREVHNVNRSKSVMSAKFPTPFPLDNEKTGRIAFWGGILFCLLFTGVIWLAGGWLDTVALQPDQGSMWYYWQLPSPTFWTQFTAWGGYLLHQSFMWGTIFYAQRKRQRYTSGLHRINVIALIGNAAFILLHFVQTQIWYDGLAQNTSLFSAEASVVLLLVVVLVMENRRRGLFFGKRIPISQTIIDLCRRYHGYLFAWALVYTFWFHPMVATSAHLTGFLYMFLLMLQGSLFFTRIHLNRWWTTLLEVSVAVHGTVVVAQMGSDAVWAFGLGFFTLFVVTQMHGLTLRAWAHRGIILLYGASILFGYTQRGGTVFRDLSLVPLIEYGLVVALALLLGMIIFLRTRFAHDTTGKV
jgi:hypothetical protein